MHIDKKKYVPYAKQLVPVANKTYYVYYEIVNFPEKIEINILGVTSDYDKVVRLMSNNMEGIRSFWQDVKVFNEVLDAARTTHPHIIVKTDEKEYKMDSILLEFPDVPVIKNRSYYAVSTCQIKFGGKVVCKMIGVYNFLEEAEDIKAKEIYTFKHEQFKENGNSQWSSTFSSADKQCTIHTEGDCGDVFAVDIHEFKLED